MSSNLSELVERYHEEVSIEYTGKRLLFDITLTYNWLKTGSGITRTCSELYAELRKIMPVEMVAIKYSNGCPRVFKIDTMTLRMTKETVEPRKGDVIFTPELQIRGVQVPLNHPAIGYFEKYGVENIAIIYDLLPINYPENFKDTTVLGMPEYVNNIFKNYSKIICISKTVCDTVVEYANKATVKPFDLLISANDTSDKFNHLVYGWFPLEDDIRWAGQNACIMFYTSNTDTDLWFEITGYSKLDVGNTSVVVNGEHLFDIVESQIKRSVRHKIPKEMLSKYGMQKIELINDRVNDATNDNYGRGYGLSSLSINAVVRDEISVRSIIDHNIEIGYAHLGVTELKKNDNSDPDKDIVDFIDKKNDVFLMVGTIEPRKGHKIILDAFEKMWNEGFSGKLCIIGRVGWMMKDFVDSMKNHSLFREKLLLLDNAKDATLEYAYQNCDMLIQASADEGFGLPLIEAGKYNIPVMCSDIPVFREVGGEHVIYFDRDNIDDIADKIISYSKTKIAPTSNQIPIKTWSESAREYFKYICGNKEWEYTLTPLKEDNEKRKKVVVAMSFPVYPPLGGGQARVYGLYKNLAQIMDVDIVCLVGAECKMQSQTIAPGLIEHRVPKQRKFELNEISLAKKAGISVTDMSLLLYNKLVPDYESMLREFKDADVVVACHPYTYEMIKSVFPDKILVYEAQDVEYNIKKSMYQENEDTAKALATLNVIEKKCCDDSAFIMTCSYEDKNEIARLYNVPLDKIIVVPNGVDCKEMRYVDLATRIQNKKEAGYTKTTGVFMGSGHKPNIDAALAIIDIAPKCTSTEFLLMGSVCEYFKETKLPDNVKLLGIVTDEEKRNVFKSADFALNPIETGSGTNLKIFDYMAQGVPVITTLFGSRGIEDKEMFIISENDKLADTINCFELKKCEDMIEKARTYVENTFDWGVIADNMIAKIQEVM